MVWSDYINTVKDQMRNKKAKLLIEDELKDHIEEQIRAYQEDGFSYDEAEKNAILDMGDPVEVGTELNRIHRPKLEKNLLGMVIILSVCSLLVQYLVDSLINTDLDSRYFLKQAGYIIVGLGVMLLIYYVDYTMIGKYPFLLWGILYLIGIYIVLFGDRPYNELLSMFKYLYLFVPVFAGVVYRLRKLKVKGLLLSGVIGATPILLAFYGNNTSAIMHYSITILLMLNIAVGKHWFNISKKLGYLIVWGGSIGVPSILFVVSNLLGVPILNAYQISRIQAVFQRTTDEAFMYTPNLVEQALTNSRIIGSNTEFVNRIPVIESNYILIFIFNIFGIIAGIAVVGLMLFFIYKTFHIARKQKSLLGCLVGLACGLSLFVQTMFYFASNLGFYRIIHLVGQQTLPFFSSGGSNIVYSYAIAGLLLSVYRNSELINDRVILNKTSISRKSKSFIR